MTSSVDVYALRCVLYEALTGEIPFPADSQEQLILAHLSAPPPRPSAVNPSVPRSFDEVIARGWPSKPRIGTGLPAPWAALLSGRFEQWRMSAQAETMPGVQPWYPPVAPVPPYIPRTPPAYPAMAPPQRDSGGRSGRWVLPTVIAVVGALVLGGIGVVIGLLANQNSSPSENSALSASSPVAASTDFAPTRQAPPTSVTPTATPPLVQGSDQSSSRETCDQGVSLTTETGWGSRAGRGTPETSCLFARSVLEAYWAKYGRPTRGLRIVTARGAVDCLSTGSTDCFDRGPGRPALPATKYQRRVAVSCWNGHAQLCLQPVLQLREVVSECARLRSAALERGWDSRLPG